MGSQGNKEQVKKKSREEEMKKVRDEIAELQRKLKTMLDQRNGGGSDKKTP
ncbi:MAG TPA: hypothetical protein VM680_15515 [Verrucomicrobiae bacterium]|nr:hypothetical protein [Verrucomicrobiae bacterium]